MALLVLLKRWLVVGTKPNVLFVIGFFTLSDNGLQLPKEREFYHKT